MHLSSKQPRSSVRFQFAKEPPWPSNNTNHGAASLTATSTRALSGSAKASASTIDSLLKDIRWSSPMPACWQRRGCSRRRNGIRLSPGWKRWLRDCCGHVPVQARAGRRPHERRTVSLIERIGDVGRKLHTGRSRNDQVSTDFRLWVRDAIDRTDEAAGESAAGVRRPLRPRPRHHSAGLHPFATGPTGAGEPLLARLHQGLRPRSRAAGRLPATREPIAAGDCRTGGDDDSD